MPKPIARFDAESVRKSWDDAADPYAEGQSSGRDYYRYEFFGPAQLSICGDVQRKNVLDVGCGNGYFAREMARRGARVTGIDISPRMIGHARQQEAETPLGVDYQVLDAATLPAYFAMPSFDMATSCLALQDMPQIEKVFEGVCAVLRPGGRFVVSITHPCTDTPFRTWQLDSEGKKQWLCIDRYFERGAFQYTWKEWGRQFTTDALHAPLQDWFGWFLRAGFQVRSLHEPLPTHEALRSRPELQHAARVPYYLVFDLIRPVAA